MELFENYCATCKHFRQHYIKMGYRYAFVCCGHCVYPRLKTRKPQQKACGHYKQRQEKQNGRP